MSIKLDPQNQTSVVYDKFYSISDPKLSFVQKWAVLTYEGSLKESWHPQRYCERAWVLQTGYPLSQATEIFMKKCVKDCNDHKAFCRFSRLN